MWEDRATGVGAEHIDEAIEAMAEEGENEVNSPNAQQPNVLYQQVL
jgi:hypothetical protein